MLALLLLAYASYVLLVVLHELGHGLVALAFAPGEVKVYIGSYGEGEGCWHLPLGRLHLYLLRRPWRWLRGYCQHQPTRHSWQHMVLLLAGPLLPALVAAGSFYFSLQHPNGGWRIAGFVFTVIASFSLLQNLFGGRGVVMADGQRVRNDGQQLWLALRHPQLQQLPQQALALVKGGQYVEAARSYETQLVHGGPAPALFRVLQQCYWLAGQLPAAVAASERFEQALPAGFTNDDLFTRGSMLSHLNQHEAALAIYEQLIDQPQPHPGAFINRGYTRSLLGQQPAALADFDRAIADGTLPAYAYANRGLALLRLGQEAEGLADITQGLALDPAEAYGYRNLGIYHLNRQEYAAALPLFEKAQQLNPLTHGLDDYLTQTRQLLGQQPTTSN